MSRKNKKVLLITYYFPPSGGSGVQRTLKHAKYLPKFGYDTVILTAKNPSYPVYDKTLSDDIPNSCKVYKTSILEPHNIYRTFFKIPKGNSFNPKTAYKKTSKKNLADYISEWIRLNLFIPDTRVGWIPYAIKSAQNIIKKENIQCIYTSSPPFTCAVIGWILKKKTNLPWINSFRDPWTGHIVTGKRKGIVKKIETYLERKTYEACDKFEYAWCGILEDMTSKYSHVPSSKSVLIPNGFDPSDYTHTSNKKNSILTICHTGMLYEENSPTNFIDAVSSLVVKNRVCLNRFKLKLVGDISPSILKYFMSSAISKSIEVCHYVPHKESIKILLESDIALLFAEYRHIPGKFYEYLGSRKAIFAISSSIDLDRLIKKTQSGVTVPFSNKEKITDIFMSFYDKFYLGKSLLPKNPVNVDKFTRQECSRSLSMVINKLISSRQK